MADQPTIIRFPPFPPTFEPYLFLWRCPVCGLMVRAADQPWHCGKPALKVSR